MSLHVEPVNSFLRPDKASKNDRISIRRPSRCTGKIGVVLGHELAGRSAIHRNHKNFRRQVGEDNFSAIRRPTRFMGVHRRKRQLEAFAAVRFAPPNRGFRVSRVGNPLAVARDIHFSRRNPSQKGHKLLGIAVIAHQLHSLLATNDEHSLAINAGNRRPKS